MFSHATAHILTSKADIWTASSSYHDNEPIIDWFIMALVYRESILPTLCCPHINLCDIMEQALQFDSQ